MQYKLCNNLYVKLLCLFISISLLIQKCSVINIILFIVMFLYLHCRNDLMVWFCVLTAVIISIKIMTLKINIYIKIIIITVLYSIYHRSINLLILLIKLFILSPKQSIEKLVLNSNLNTVTLFFRQNFNFKHNFDKLSNIPTIYVCNYVYERNENLAWLLIPRPVYCIMIKSIGKIYKNVVKNILSKEHSQTYDYFESTIKEKINEGFSILVYVTSPSYNIGKVNRVKSGMFSIAKSIGCTITPLAIDHIYYNNIGSIPYQNYEIYVGDSFYVNDVTLDTLKTRRFFIDNINRFKQNKFDMH